MYHRGVEAATIFILAGGKSLRMGTDKAFLMLHGKTLLERSLELAAAVAEEVCIVGDPRKFLRFGKAVQDIFPECGPLGGIHAALRQTKSELNLMLAVDLPFVEERFLRYLISTAGRGTAWVTFVEADGPQPLCAVYRREFAEAAEKSLLQGRNKVDSLFPGVETRVIAAPELSRLGFSTRMFRNLNTPEDFARAESDIVAAGLPEAAERN